MNHLIRKLLLFALVFTLPASMRLTAAPTYVPLANFAQYSAMAPYGGLVKDGVGNFWGTTNYGGLYGLGTLFVLNPSTGGIITVVNFDGGGAFSDNSRGGNPQASLVSDGAGNLWGTTTNGGAYGGGTAFKVDVATGVVTTVVDFSSAPNPAPPQAALVSDGVGNLWGTTSSGGTVNEGAVFKINIATGALTTVASFYYSIGTNPLSSLVSDGAGNFWGTTANGGANGWGTVFAVNSVTGIINVIANFDNSHSLSDSSRGGIPQAGLVSDGAGNFWGTTSTGGTGGDGTIFKVSASTGTMTTVADFDGSNSPTDNSRGANPQAALVKDAAGNLWGTTAKSGISNYGTVFKIGVVSGTLSTVADFDDAPYSADSTRGATPRAAMVSDGAGNLWGTTSAGGSLNDGTVFKIKTTTGAITTVSDISADGQNPRAGLVSDGAGNLWGTTANGGNGHGTVFKYNQSTGVVITVATFDGSLSGTDPYRGADPQSGLVSDGAGYLWGTTELGGDGVNSQPGVGTVFKIKVATGALTTVVDFDGSMSLTDNSRGAEPVGGLVSDGAGNLWGTTSVSGHQSCGTVFKINTTSGAITTVADFDGSNSPTDNTRGSTPEAGMVSDGAGHLWGDTFYGGASNCGVVFKITATSGSMTTVTDLDGSNSPTDPLRGASPRSALASDGTGNFWGTTVDGGVGNLGVVFKISATSGTMTTVADFDGSNSPTDNSRGANPQAALVKDAAGNLWGTTPVTGANGVGTVFKVASVSGSITTVFDFTDTTGPVPGNNPAGALLWIDGGLYGTTYAGGASGEGELFLIQVTGPTLTENSAVVSSSNVVLSGTVNPNGTAGPSANKTNVLAYWQYGPAVGDYTSKTTAIPLGTGTSAVSISGTFNKPAAGIYHYQLVVSSTLGLDYGPDQFFSVESPTTEYGSTSATGTGAGLTVSVDPNGLDTSVSIQWGLTTAYTGGTISLGDIGSGYSPVILSTTLTGLTPGIEYYYRVVTTNVLGTVDGPAQTLATAASFVTAPMVWAKEPAPGITGAFFGQLGNPIMNGSDQIAFQASVTGGGTTMANNSGIWKTGMFGALTLVVQTGSAAPGYTTGTSVGTFSALSDPVFTDNGSVAFLGTLVSGTQAGQPNSATNKGIWSTTSGPLLLVARAGDFAPDASGSTTAASPVFASISQLVLPQQGGVVILAKLVTGMAASPGPGGVVATNNFGIWGVDTDGLLKLIIRTGDGMQVDGSAKTITGLSIFAVPTNSNGQTRNFNNAGDLTYKATFGDGSSAVIQTVFP